MFSDFKVNSLIVLIDCKINYSPLLECHDIIKNVYNVCSSVVLIEKIFSIHSYQVWTCFYNTKFIELVFYRSQLIDNFQSGYIKIICI